MGSQQSRTQGAGAPIIAHVDMDAFYVEAELLDKPELRGRKIIVAGGAHDVGDPRQRASAAVGHVSEGRYVVLSASYQARTDGVRSAMPLTRARRLSPDSVIIPPQMHRYRELSAAIMEYFDTLTHRKEQLSVDEAFLDLTGARRRLGDPEQMGRLIRTGLRERVGLPATVGIADRKFIAKIASTKAKPDGLLVVPPQRRTEFLHSLAATELWGVGAKTAEALAGMGLRTVAQIAETPKQALARRLGAVGEQLHDLAWGIDPREVEPHRVEKSIGAEETFAADVHSEDQLRRELLRLAHKVAARLRAAEVAAHGVSLKLRWRDFSTLTRSATLPHGTQSAPELHRHAVRMLAGLGPRVQPVRLVGIRAERLGAADGSLQLSFDAHDDDWLAAQRALDRVAGKFPGSAVRPAALLDPREDGDTD
ncbi:DNA polymerase IV [Nesterenkonia ebinurensis]|uniref:DNA polymerase IV n=1 Tax=Nesterenkonia ebinurensis TaxID=2608252 RepID=UPI00123CAE53|nr:DNA polymerase IV [Nesterenkonia ebinurensis]